MAQPGAMTIPAPGQARPMWQSEADMQDRQRMTEHMCVADCLARKFLSRSGRLVDGANSSPPGTDSKYFSPRDQQLLSITTSCRNS